MMKEKEIDALIFLLDDPDQEVHRVVMEKHIDLYVNDFSVELGEEGLKAVKALLSRNGTVMRENDLVGY